MGLPSQAVLMCLNLSKLSKKLFKPFKFTNLGLSCMSEVRGSFGGSD